MATDSSQLIENNVAITDNLLYTVKPSAVRGRQYRASIPASTSNVANCGTTSIFYVPARSNCFLDGKQTALQFTIKNTSSNNLAMKTDGFGSSTIARVDIFHGSNLCESISNYNVLASLIYDANLDPAQKVALSGLYGGGNSVTVPRNGATITSTSSAVGQLTVTIPLLSSICGVGLDKYLDLNLSDDIRIEVTWADEISGMVSAASTADTFITGYSTSWYIQSPQMLCTIIELDAQGMALVNSVAPPSGEKILHGTSYRSYNANMPSNSSGGGFSTLVPARFASLQAVLLAPRISSVVIAKEQNSISNRINPNVSDYSWRLGGAQIPNRNVVLINSSTTGSYSEALYEFSKCFPNSTGNCLRSDYYNVAKSSNAQTGVTAPADGASTSAFAIGQEFCMFSGKSDVLLCGVNTLSSNLFWEANISSSGNDAMTLNFFAVYDCLFVIQDGIISSRF